MPPGFAGRTRRLGLIGLLAALTTLLGTGPAGAQALTGRVVDADRGLPIADARVLLLDSAGPAVDSATTTGEGRFRVRASAPGAYLLHVEVRGYLSYSDAIRLESGETARHTVEMPVVSVAAAVVMKEVIDREAAFQLPLEDLCQEPLRPWEAGVLVGVARERQGLQPVPRAVVHLEPLPDSAGRRVPAAPRSRVATATGAYWFCNVPGGSARLVVRAPGLAADTFHAVIRPGTMSWYDALLGPGR